MFIKRRGGCFAFLRGGVGNWVSSWWAEGEGEGWSAVVLVLVLERAGEMSKGIV